MIWLVAIGATPTIEWVHIWCRSMVAIICGPTKCRMNSGRALVSAAPTSPHPAATSSAAATKPICRWKIPGYSSLKKWNSAARLVFRPE